MDKNLRYWVALNQALVENLGVLSKIVQHFPSVQEVFRPSSIADLKACGLDEEKAGILTSNDTLAVAEREIEKLAQKKYTILTLEDRRYPDYLREIFDPPCVLYCAGNVEVFSRPSISIVGARKPTPYGRAVAEKLARDLASRGLVVVSGMARGIDSLAHWGALQGGNTAAVLGSGLDRVYPKENRMLCAKIKEKGVVVTEYPLTSPPLGHHFPMRNRIISGLSLAVVVIEAAAKSGSLISARLALEQNRDVMAVPGNLTSEMSRGTNWLIKRGAKLVEDWRDVVEELPSYLREQLLTEETEEVCQPEMNAREEHIYTRLRADSQLHVDDLVEMTNLSVSEVLSLLLHLELKGLVVQSAGKYFQRKL
ncbi:MAG: DNA-processing protein DprA [Candidatus Aminicenantes bacterium]|nr:DNA-processing protein DprA [Candidatus Aminicenantes bacterium]